MLKSFTLITSATMLAATVCASLALADNPPSDPAQPSDATPPSGQPPQPNQSTPSGTQQTDPDNEVVCKRMDPPTGSRAGARRVCKTVKEWKAIAADSKQGTSQMQQNQGHEPSNRPGT